jgi:gamma-glutamyltranspeptidase/glutathione hydrolase
MEAKTRPGKEPSPGQIKPTRVDTDLLELGDRKIYWPQKVAVSRRGMISTAHHRATEAGVEMLESGGNAFDAAVAAAFALGVCEPAASGLGGQTMLLIHDAETGQTIALDGSSRAPNRATAEALSKVERRRGYRATTVPSTPAVLRYVLERYGKLKLARVLEPSIRLAEDGYAVSVLQRALARRELKNLKNHTAGPLFLRDGKKTYQAGTIFKQQALADTLRRLAKKGIKDFYAGQIAKAIHDDMARNDGFIQQDDLAQVPRPIERRPITTRFNGNRVFTFPLPGAGRTLIEMMNVYQQLPASRQALDRPEGAVFLAEIIRRAFVDRQDRPFDPHFFAQVSEKRMLSQDYAKLVAQQTMKRFKGHGETTHLSVMDKDGNTVALTQSIERVYGSYSATAELGFLYNNYMSAFEYEDISHPYYMRPNAAPWASVAPTIVFRGRKPWLAIGSPGSERITSAILQVLIRLEAANPLAAVDAPRLHSSLDGKVSLEATRMRSDIPEALKRYGFDVDVRDPYSFYLGCVQLVMRDKHELIGVADPRRDGAAGGPTRRAMKTVSSHSAKAARQAKTPAATQTAKKVIQK